MKVKLADQTFSRSVSDALKYLHDSKTVGFQECEPTIEFIRQIDRAFDILNSKSKYGQFNKLAVTPARLDELRGVCEEFKAFLLGLKNPENRPLHTSRRKTFIVGFVNTFEAALALAHDLFQCGNSYFPTFRISQDLVIGFKSALRNKLAKQAITASKSSNSLDCDSSAGVFALTWSKRTPPLPGDEEVEIPDELSSQLAS